MSKMALPPTGNGPSTTAKAGPAVRLQPAAGRQPGVTWPHMVRRHMWVSGTVQGVWYRGSCAEHARVFAVSGCRNLPDGRVEVVAEGEPEAVDQLVQWCHQGPAYAYVTGVEVRAETPEGLTGFTVR